MLTGLGMAVGVEGMPFLMRCAAVVTVRAIQNRESAGSMRAYGFSVAASTIVTPVALGGLGLAMTTYSCDPRNSVRCRLIAAVAVAIVFVLSEPRCLGGPYAMVDPAVKKLWLADVQEMQPFLSIFATCQRPECRLTNNPAKWGMCRTTACTNVPDKDETRKVCSANVSASARPDISPPAICRQNCCRPPRRKPEPDRRGGAR